jgi:hypothetical protein
MLGPVLLNVHHIETRQLNSTRFDQLNATHCMNQSFRYQHLYDWITTMLVNFTQSLNKFRCFQMDWVALSFLCIECCWIQNTDFEWKYSKQSAIGWAVGHIGRREAIFGDWNESPLIMNWVLAALWLENRLVIPIFALSPSLPRWLSWFTSLDELYGECLYQDVTTQHDKKWFSAAHRHQVSKTAFFSSEKLKCFSF